MHHFCQYCQTSVYSGKENRVEEVEEVEEEEEEEEITINENGVGNEVDIHLALATVVCGLISCLIYFTNMT